jgi:hypothetical protein
MNQPVIKNGVKDYYTSWDKHCNYKLYSNRKSAIDAVNQIKKSHKNAEFRIVALYNFRNNGYKTYIINKIIKEDKTKNE